MAASIRIYAKDSSNTAVEGAKVVVSLVTASNRDPGYLNGGTVLSKPTIKFSDNTGLTTFVLPANSDIIPAGTVYKFEIYTPGSNRPKLDYFDVPTGSSTYDVEDRLVEQPGELESAALASHVLSIGNHADVDLTGLASGKVLMWNGTDWTPVDTVATDLEAAALVTAHNALTAVHGATGAVVGTTNTQTLTNKTLTSPVVNSPTGIVKGDVGLGNADNTSDLAKPVSTATQTALDAKAATASTVMDGDAAGGVLSGTYPSPGFAADMASQAELDGEAAARAADDEAFRERVFEGELVFNVKDYGAVGNGVADDTAEIALAIAAAVDGGIVYFPPGTYLTSAVLDLDSDGLTIRGAGRMASYIVNNTGDVFRVGNTGTITGLQVEQIAITASAGDIFNQQGGVSRGAFRHLFCKVTNTAKHIWYNDDNGVFLDCSLEWFVFEGLLTHTVPLWSMVDSIGGLNANKVNHGRCTNSGEYVFHIESDNASNYAYDWSFKHVNFEVTNGGNIRFLSCHKPVVEECYSYDLGTTTKDLYYYGKSALGPATYHPRIRLAHRRGGTLGGGLYDIKFQTDGSMPVRRAVIDDCNNVTGGFKIDLGGNNAVLLHIASDVTVDNEGPLTHRFGDTGLSLGGGVLLTDTDEIVQKSLWDANTILAANSDNTPAALTVAEQRLVGRITGGSIDDLTVAQVKTLLAYAAGDIAFTPTGGLAATTTAAALAELDTEKASDADPLDFGFPMTFDPRFCSSVAVIGAVNRGIWYRVHGGGPVSKIGMHISTSSGNICVAIYANSGTGVAARPTTRLATSGSVASPGTGYQEVSLGQTIDVTSGDHWFFLSADNNTVTFARSGTTAVVSTFVHGLTETGTTAHPAADPAVLDATPAGVAPFALIGVP